MKLRISVVLGFLLLMSFQSAFSQSSKIDSLQKEIEILQLKNLIDSLKRAKVVVVPVVSVDGDEYAAKQEVLKKDILNLNTEVFEMKMNLDMCHKRFKTGLLTEIAGAGLFVLGTLLLSSTTSTSSSSSQELATVGSAMVLFGISGIVVGNIFMTNSHKYIGYAGQRKATYIKPSNLYTR
jgi:hypothetical protein